MGSKATRVEDQIEILAKRGMDLDIDNDKIKEILLDIGYYRLGFYWHPFEIDDDHNFANGTKFSDIVELYYLDVDLRTVLLKYLYRIELNFRTKIIYYVSNKYKTTPTWFVDTKVMQKSFVDTFDDYYNDEFIEKNKQIKNHHTKYINDRYAPAWKTLEFLTFGQILKIYKSLKEEDIRLRIAQIYGVRNIEKFINLFETIIYVRNCCSHSSVVFDLNLSKSISAFAEIQFNSRDRHNLDSCIKVILFIIGKISENRRTEMEASLNVVYDKHKANLCSRSIIEKNIGHVFEADAIENTEIIKETETKVAKM